jgi:hypothetical protein
MSQRALPAKVTGNLRALSTEIDRLERAGYIRRRPAAYTDALTKPGDATA